MAVNESYLNYVLDQLSDFEEEITWKKMFGGVGIFSHSMMFALITADDVFMLKTDESNRSDFESLAMEPFKIKGKAGKMPYFTVPEEVIEQSHTLKIWAEKAFEVAKKVKRKKK